MNADVFSVSLGSKRLCSYLSVWPMVGLSGRASMNGQWVFNGGGCVNTACTEHWIDIE